MSPFDHTHRRPALSIRRAEQEPPLPHWVRRATALGPLARRPRRSSAASCGRSSGGSVSVRPRTPTVVAVYSPGRAGAAASGLGPPGLCAGAAGPPPSPFLCRCLRVVVAEHCQPQEGGVSPFDHVHRRSPLSIRRAEQELPLSDWARRATAVAVYSPAPRRGGSHLFLYPHQLLGLVPDVMLDGQSATGAGRPVTSGDFRCPPALRAEGLFGVLEFECARRCQAGRVMVGDHAKPPGVTSLSTGVKAYLVGSEVSVLKCCSVPPCGGGGDLQDQIRLREALLARRDERWSGA